MIIPGFMAQGFLISAPFQSFPIVQKPLRVVITDTTIDKSVFASEPNFYLIIFEFG